MLFDLSNRLEVKLLCEWMKLTANASPNHSAAALNTHVVKRCLSVSQSGDYVVFKEKNITGSLSSAPFRLVSCEIFK